MSQYNICIDISVSFRPFFYIIIACLTMNQNEFSMIEEVIYVLAFTAEFLPFYEYKLFCHQIMPPSLLEGEGHIVLNGYRYKSLQ